MDRRPLKVRSAKWASSGARLLANNGITPNMISILSVIFASFVIVTGMYSSKYNVMYLVGALCIQLRLICNLLDGMVAVEHAQASANGELYNDVPDRFADLFIILGVSLSVFDKKILGVNVSDLAWASIAMAIMTAYVRVLGKSLGTKSYFIGPMAKQHRMFLLTMVLIIEFFMSSSEYSGSAIMISLIMILIGSIYTTFRRLTFISKDLLRGVSHDS